MSHFKDKAIDARNEAQAGEKLSPIIERAAQLRRDRPQDWIRKKVKKCPECNSGTLLERSGKFGDFIGCSGYPKCKYSKKC